jgi:hypothetical protein
MYSLLTGHNNIQDAGVQYILDSVVKALLENPERKWDSVLINILKI